MPLRDLLKKREKIASEDSEPIAPLSPPLPQASEFRFMRTETNVEEEIQIPAYEGEVNRPSTPPTTPKRKALSRLRKSSNATSPESSPSRSEPRRLSERLHISSSKSRASSTSSSHIPADLPTIDDAYSDHGDQQEKEARWEQRATILAQEKVNAEQPKRKKSGSRPPTAELEKLDVASDNTPGQSRERRISDAAGDANIQEAIRLHESGELPQATAMFRTLAGRGNVLSQVLYGLSLRHGWGCDKDEQLAVKYLSEAASNSAAIEQEALKSGLKKGGAAKGELVLAIFELANCFRYGWGVAVDKVAARQYYETAANLGDTDAMNEAAWCYLEGFGGKKDKVGLLFCSVLL